MEPNQITKQALDYQRGAFSSWYGAMSIIQEQAAVAVNTMLSQASWIPDQGRQVILSWLSACKNECDRCKVYVEENFSGLEKYFVQEKKGVPVAESKKPAPKEKNTAPAQETK